jgi:hypothetical protein
MSQKYFMNFPHSLQPQGQGKELTRKLELQDRFDILLEMRLSDVARQGYRKLDSRLYVAEVVSHKHERRISNDEQSKEIICVGADCRNCFA